MKRDPAGRLGSRELRQRVVWILRLIFIATLPAAIVAFISYGVLTALLTAGSLFSAFVAVAVLGAWLEGYFERYDR